MNAWYEKANFYHIYPLGLCGVIHESKESKYSLDCNKTQESESLRSSEKEGLSHNQFIKLKKWIPHLVNIGCNAIYIGPLFESETHGYDTIDYKKVDSRLGSNNDFKDYVEYCHQSGIKVVVDGVFNHTGREFFAFLDIKEKKQQSRYKDWYNINFNGNSTYQDGFAYDGWRGHYNLVQLNLKNKEVRDYLFGVVKYWIQEFDIDGIRLDCADVLDFNFMKELRNVGDSLKKDFWLMGEVIHGDYSRWVNNEMLHSVTNYELHKGLYSGHNDHNYFEIAHTIKRLFDPQGGLCKGNLLYTFLDNHDVERICNKLTNTKNIYPITILLYTLPGIPSIYYGSEWLIQGKKENSSDDSLRPMIQIEDYVTEIQGKEVQLKYHKEHEKLINLIKKLAGMRSTYDELAYGSYKELLLTNRQYSFARVLEKGAVIVAVNNDEKEAILTIKSPLEGKKAIDLLSGKEVKLVNNSITLTLNANDGIVLLISEELD
jgi:glycosidase